MPRPDTPLEWLRWLYPQLVARRRDIDRWVDHYRGRNIVEIVARDFVDIFEGLLDPPRTNLCAIATEAATERLEVDAFTVATFAEPAEGETLGERQIDEQGRRLAERVWHESDLDVWAEVCHTDASVRSMSYLMVWPTEAGNPSISVESARDVIGWGPQRPPYDLQVAIKVVDDPWDGGQVAEVFLAGEGVYRYRRDGSYARSTMAALGAGGIASDVSERGLVVPGGLRRDMSGWRPFAYDGQPDNALPLPGPWREAGMMPVVEVANSPSTDEPPVSDLEDVIPLAIASDRILADLMIAASFGAVPMRFATGVTLGKPERDEWGRVRYVDDRGNEVPAFDTRADRVWVSPDPNSKMGTLEGSTLEGFIRAIQLIRTDFRARTRVPLHYFDMGGTSGTAGELLKALEGPLQRRIARISRRRGAAWRRVMRLALTLLDDRYREVQIRTNWADTETRSEAQAADALSKLADAGVPLEMTLEHVLGWRAEQITRAMQLREQQQMSADAALAAITGGSPLLDDRDATGGGTPPRLVGPDGQAITAGG